MLTREILRNMFDNFYKNESYSGKLSRGYNTYTEAFGVLIDLTGYSYQGDHIANPNNNPLTEQEIKKLYQIQEILASVPAPDKIPERHQSTAHEAFNIKKFSSKLLELLNKDKVHRHTNADEKEKQDINAGRVVPSWLFKAPTSTPPTPSSASQTVTLPKSGQSGKTK